MTKVRAQYHFRQTSTGLDAWDVRRLIALSEKLPVKQIDPNNISEIDANHWYLEAGLTPTPRSIIDHAKLIAECDISYPIILDSGGRLMDGMHRVCRAIMDKVDSLPAVQFLIDPPPDHTDCDPKKLPYDND